MQGQSTASTSGRDHSASIYSSAPRRPPGRASYAFWKACKSRGGRQTRSPVPACCSAAALSSSSSPQAATATADAPEDDGFRDSWIARSLATLGPADGSASDRLHSLRQASREALQALRMPTTRSEEYRFTDLRPILDLQAQAAPGGTVPEEAEGEAGEAESGAARVRVVDGVVAPAAAGDAPSLPEGVFLGPLQAAPAGVLEQLGRQSQGRGSPFAVLNGALARDALVLAVAEGVELEAPVHVQYFRTGGSNGTATASAPRLLCVLGAGASARLTEEFVGAREGAPHFVNAVAEVALAEGARLEHGYVSVGQGLSLQMKATLVAQAARSSYALTEARTGATLSRHDLNIAQEGPETRTAMKTFLLAGERQTHDLHSKLQLDFPRGTADQLHKCIVASPTGRGVFDGRVRVERAAQQTDAGQLSRNLLLSPRASVNVKPSLQIIADDVKCTHGAAISDLEEDQLFYFRTRGIDPATARRVLVYSFGAEVTGALPKALRGRIQTAVDAALAGVRLDDAEP